MKNECLFTPHPIFDPLIKHFDFQFSFWPPSFFLPGIIISVNNGSSDSLLENPRENPAIDTRALEKRPILFMDKFQISEFTGTILWGLNLRPPSLKLACPELSYQGGIKLGHTCMYSSL